MKNIFLTVSLELVLVLTVRATLKVPIEGGMPPSYKGAAPGRLSSYIDMAKIHSAVVSSAQNFRTAKAIDEAMIHAPKTPEGYELVFGPTNGANNAPGYMGFAYGDHAYDVSVCAEMCNKRDPDPLGGLCQYFNIWQGIVNGTPASTTCAFYYLPTNASTAVNYGNGDVVSVAFSRGYRRKTFVIDGGFEEYSCSEFCYASSYANWIGSSPKGGALDATIFHYQPYAFHGGSVALLGSAGGNDALPGTLAPTKYLETKAGSLYTLTFFHSSSYSGPDAEKDAFFEILWNGKVVKTIRPGYQSWTHYYVTVIGKGNDQLALRGGKAPAWSFIDDVNVFLS